MRTSIEINDDVLREAQQMLGTATKRETVDAALREVVARHRRLGTLELRGKVRVGRVTLTSAVKVTRPRKDASAAQAAAPASIRLQHRPPLHPRLRLFQL
jgi:hypothetical protein